MNRKFTLLVAIVLAFVGITAAFAHHQGDFFPIPRSSYILETRLETTGEWVWSYEQRCNTGNIYADIKKSFDDTSVRYKFINREDYATAGQYAINQNNVSTCGTDFTGRCGAGFAVACVGADSPGFPRNCDAYYDGPYMATFYSADSRASVPKHEYTHCRDGRAEGYCDVQESVAPCNAGVTCQPSPSIMGCGSQHPLDYSSYDDSAYRLRHYPPKLAATGYGYNGNWYVYGCGFDASASELAVLVNRNDGRGVVWSGVTLPIVKDTVNGCMGIGPAEKLTITPGFVYYLKQENRLSRFESFNEACVRGSVGC